MNTPRRTRTHTHTGSPAWPTALGWALALLVWGGAAQAAEVSAELRIGVPAWGSAVATLPHGAVAVVLGPHRRYWYHRGVWFRPLGAQFVVVAPPAAERGAPAEAPSGDGGLQAATAARPEPVFKSTQPQEAQQTERDLRACQRVAVGRQDALNDASVFQQVVQSCMLNRGYSVQ
jgi:hypothetical protein